MSANQETNIEIVTKIDKENLGPGLEATALNGFVDIDHAFDITGGRILRIEKVFPFSLISIVETPMNGC